jgi:hypothetical protein
MLDDVLNVSLSCTYVCKRQCTAAATQVDGQRMVSSSARRTPLHGVLGVGMCSCFCCLQQVLICSCCPAVTCAGACAQQCLQLQPLRTCYCCLNHDECCVLKTALAAGITIGSGWDGGRCGGACGFIIVTPPPSLTRVLRTTT